MNWYVVEVENNRIKQVTPFPTEKDARQFAAIACERNGIAFEEPVSMDGEFTKYSLTLIQGASLELVEGVLRDVRKFAKQAK